MLLRTPRRFARTALVSLLLTALAGALLALSPTVANAAPSQITIFDDSAVDGPSEYAKVDNIGPSDWTRPTNFSAGNAYAKLDITEKPSDKALRYQVCFWRDSFSDETCSSARVSGAKGTVWIDLGTPAEWWSKGGTWTWDRTIAVSRIMIKDAETGRLMKSRRCGSFCYSGDDLSKHSPIKMHAEMIVVAPGSTLQPPADWAATCPPVWSGQCKGDPGAAGFVVEAGKPVTVAPGTPLRLDGRVYGGTADSVNWAKVSGPSGLRWAEGRYRTDPIVQFKNTGDYVLRFKALSDAEGKAIDDLHVSVRDGAAPAPKPAPSTSTTTTQPPKASTPDQPASDPLSVDAGDPITVTAGEKITLEGVVTGGSGKVSSVWWKRTGGSMAWSTKSGPTPTVSFSRTGDYVLRFRARDEATTATDDLVVTVVAEAADSTPATDPPKETTTPTTAPKAPESSGGPDIRIRPASITEGNSGSKSLVFKVVLSAPHGTDVVVQFKTADRTADAGDDYMERSLAIVIPAGDTRAFVGVPVHGDRMREGTEYLSGLISDATAGTIVEGKATGKILDND